ncbi:hypothetical protein D3C75_930840 [compost metagenome]
MNGANTVFTVTNAGRYRISYAINATAAIGLGISSQILINGTTSAALTNSPTLATNRLEGDAIVTLPAGATISLFLTGIVALIALVSPGATLTIVRLS